MPILVFALTLACVASSRAQSAVDGPTEHAEPETPSETAAESPDASTEATPPGTSESEGDEGDESAATPAPGVEEDASTDDAGAEPSAAAETGEAQAQNVPPRRIRFVGFPFAFYLPETSVGFGFGIGVSIATRRPPEGSAIRWFPSNLTIGGAYTIRNQMRILFTPELYLRQGRLVIDGLTEVRFYPDRFYGLGRDTDAHYQRYTDVSIKTSTAFRYQLRPGVYVGAVLDIAGTEIKRVADTDSNGDPRPATPSTDWLGTGAVPGESGSRVFGVGATFVLDRRDFALMSQSGYYVRLVVVPYPGLGDATSRYLRGLVDVRGFIPIRDGDVVLAAQWLLSAVSDGAPFNHLASVGGAVGMRSYPDGRFRDSMQTYGQVELRFPLFWRIRGAVHTAIGAVGGSESQDRPFDLLWAAGIGLRAVLLPDRRLAVRGDLVLGPEGLRVLAYVHEAF